MHRTSLPIQEKILVASSNTALLDTGLLFDEANLRVNTSLVSGKLGLVSAEPGQAEDYNEFIATGSSVTDNRFVKIVQGTPNGSLRYRNNVPTRDLPVVQSYVIDGRQSLGFAATVAQSGQHSIWTLALGSTPVSETNYDVHIGFSGVKNSKFYSMRNIDSFTTSVKTPDFAVVTYTNTTDYLLQTIAHNVNQQSKAYVGYNPTINGHREIIALCVDKAGTQGALMNTFAKGIASISGSTLTTVGAANITVGDIVRMTATNGGGVGMSILATVATKSGAEIATSTYALENSGYGYTGNPTTFTYEIVTSANASAALGTATGATTAVIATPATSIVVEHTANYTVSLDITKAITNSFLELLANDDTLRAATCRIVPINTSGSTLSSIGTAGSSARTEALILMGLDHDYATVTDETFSNRVRLHVGGDESADVSWVITEEVKQDRPTGEGRYWKIISDRRYKLNQYAEQGLPVYEDYIQVPDYIDTTVNYNAYVITNGYSEVSGYSHTYNFPKRTIILVPSTYSTVIASLEAIVGDWLASATTLENKDTPTSFGASFFA